MKKGFLNNKKKSKKQWIAAAMATNANTKSPASGELPALDTTDSLLASMVEQKMGIGSSAVKKNSGYVGLKLPIGKVDTTLPKDYVLDKLKLQLQDPQRVNYDDDESRVLYTTLPPQYLHHTSADNPDGWSECLFHGGHQKRAILSIPGFPFPVPKPPQARYRIGPSTHGLGMFATRDLSAYDLILAERPLLVCPTQISLDPSLLGGSVTAAEAIQIGMAMHEEALKLCIDRMMPDRREAFYALHNCHTEDGSGPIFGRVRTNGIGFSIDPPPNSKVDKSLFRNSGTFDVISRVNHSCMPNATSQFQDSSFSLTLLALRPIKKGDEIFISYVAPDLTRDKRQEALLTYGFSCACEACLDPEHDAIAASISNSIDISNIFYSNDPNKMLEESHPWIKKIEDAKLEGLPTYALHILRAYTLSLQLGKVAQVNKYRKAYESLIEKEWMSTLFEGMVQM